MPNRSSWIEEETGSPLIEQHARKLDSFVEALADGRVDASELEDQQERVTRLMREIEPQLDDVLHEKVTRLLCEIVSFDIMQCLYSMQQAAPKTKFRG